MSILRISVLLACIFMLIMNTVGSSSIGTDVGTLSDRYQTRVLAAGYAFSIWGIIFIGTLGYALYQVRGNAPSPSFLDQLAPYAIAAFLATGIWIPIFQLERFPLSLVVMLILLGSLAMIFRIINEQATLSSTELWLIEGSFSIFLGWITAATVLNFSQTLMALNWNGFGIGDVAWGVTMLIAAGLIAATVAYFGGGNFFYAGTVVWALVAVSVNQADVRILVTTPIIMSLVILIAAAAPYFSLTGGQTVG
ncbi:MAG: hypothetical protein AAF633_18820 [Chloroflexota bacterium]